MRSQIIALVISVDAVAVELFEQSVVSVRAAGADAHQRSYGKGKIPQHELHPQKAKQWFEVLKGGGATADRDQQVSDRFDATIKLAMQRWALAGH
jgi:hypothetical protein